MFVGGTREAESEPQAAFRWSLTLPLTRTPADLRWPALTPRNRGYLTGGTVSAGISRPNTVPDLNLPGRYESR